MTKETTKAGRRGNQERKGKEESEVKEIRIAEERGERQQGFDIREGKQDKKMMKIRMCIFNIYTKLGFLLPAPL